MMKTSGDVRRENLATLVKEAGGVSAFSALMGKPTSAQVSQWLNASKDSKTGKPRQISNSSARAIEIAVNRPHGWLDQDHTAETTPPGDPPRPPTIPEDLWRTLPPKARALVEDIVRKSADGTLREADLALLSSTADRLSGDD